MRAKSSGLRMHLKLKCKKKEMQQLNATFLSYRTISLYFFDNSALKALMSSLLMYSS